MDLQLKGNYKYIEFLGISGESLPNYPKKEIIYSSRVNNDFLGSMFAKNFDNNRVILDRMTYGNLTSDEISMLGQVGVMQFDREREMDLTTVGTNQYEYSTLLDTVELSVINIPEEVHSIAFQEVWGGPTDIIDIDKLGTAKKLLFLAKSSVEIKNLSQEIHNLMLEPHSDCDDYILYDKDITNTQSMLLVNEDNINIQARIKLGELIGSYEDTGDTLYLQGIADHVGNSYNIILNEKSWKV